MKTPYRAESVCFGMGIPNSESSRCSTPRIAKFGHSLRMGATPLQSLPIA
jgi:hypothetical protein